MPYYDAYNENIEYDYQIIANVINAKFNDTNGNQKEIGNNNKAVIQDSDTSNNSVGIGGYSYLKGDASTRLLSLNKKFVPSGKTTGIVNDSLSKPYDESNGVITTGSGYQVRITSRVVYGPFEGGTDNLLVWNPNLASITTYDDGSWFKAFYSGETEPISTVKLKFGIYNVEGHGDFPSTTEEINNAQLESFIWYESYDEAIKHGKVSGLCFSNQDYRGNNLQYAYTTMFKAAENSDYIGKTIVYRTRLYYYANSDSRETKKGIYKFYNATSYLPTLYENGNIKRIGSPYFLGETILIVGVRSKVTTSVLDLDSSNNSKSAYDVKDYEINVAVTPSITDDNSTNDANKTVHNVIVKSFLPKGLTYKIGSSNKNPESVDLTSDGTEITWKYDDYQINHPAPGNSTITYKALISSAIENNTSIGIKSKIFVDEDTSDEEKYRTSEYGIRISNLSGVSSSKTVDNSLVNSNESFKVSTTINNNSDNALTNVKTLEILPRNNVNGSKFSGTYTTEVVESASSQEIYYTTNNIENIGITKDSYGKDTISEVDLKNDSRWKKINLESHEIIPKEATAIATIIPKIEDKSSCKFVYRIVPQNNKMKDQYNFVMNTSSNELTSAVMTNVVAVQVKEYKVTEEHYYIGTDKAFLIKEKSYSYKDEYETKIADDDEINYKKYEFERTSGDSPTGEVTKNITVKYYYGLKTYNLNVYHYINGIASPITEHIEKNYGDSYVTEKHKDIDYKIYELDSTKIPENSSGTILGDTEVKYYYVLKKYDIVIHHFKEGTNEKVAEDEIYEKKYVFNQNYETSKKGSLIDENYNPQTGYVKPDSSPASGTVTDNLEIIYYYKLKTADIIINHLELSTNKVLVPQEKKPGIQYTKSYNSSVSNSVGKNYSFIKAEGENNAPLSGIVNSSIVKDGKIIINYYYSKKDYSGTINITKDGTKVITKKNESVKYTINYTAEATDYIGTGTIKIIDYLPYKIDQNKSNLNGGTYNDSTKTITWNIDWSNIDTFDGEKKKEVKKEIELIYVGLNDKNMTLTNKVTGYLTLGEKDILPVQNEITSNIQIPGKVIIKYIDIDTLEEIAATEQKTGLLYEMYSSEEKIFDSIGYDLVEKPGNEVVYYSEDGVELIYKYKKREYKIITRTDGYGGSIEGDEIVKFGMSSTENKIKINAKEGYEIDKITINGEELDFDGSKSEMILDYFKNVTEDKNVIVSFKQLPLPVPNTLSNKNIISTVLGCILLSISFILVLINKRKFLQSIN